MVDIPEHLLQRSKERRKALGLPVPGEEGGEAEAPAAGAPAAEASAEAPAAEAPAEAPAASAPAEDVTTESGTKIPAHLLERAKRRRAAAGGGGGDVAAAGTGAAAAATATLPAPTTTGPGGHTQRLLTVVKSGSIQQTRAEAQDKVHTWPHLLVVEFASILIVTAALLIFSALGEGAAARPRRLQQDARTRRRHLGTSSGCRNCSRCSTRRSRVCSSPAWH